MSTKAERNIEIYHLVVPQFLASTSDTGKDGIKKLCSQQIPAICENPSSILNSKKVVYAAEYQVL